jgi:hypothetical protein
MSSDQSYEELLGKVLDIAIRNNQRIRPGTPMFELKAAIEAALTALPPLEFDEFTQAIGDTDAAAKLVQRAPEMIGWNADQIVEWLEQLSGRINTPGGGGAAAESR